MSASERLTLTSLPSEILDEIVYHCLSPTSIHSRYATLTTLCLVSHLFHSLAQPVIWRDIYLYHDSTGHKLLASSVTQARKHKARHVRIFGDLNWDGVENETAGEILKLCEGVRVASLFFFEAMNAKMMECRNLDEIHTLRLSSNVDPLSCPSPLDLPFRATLTSLTLSTFTYPPHLIHSLLSCPKLVHLDLLTYGGSRSSLDTAFLTAFPPCAAQLVSLALPPRTNMDFLPLLSHCVNLESLTTDERIPEVLLATLHALPSATPTLKTWSTVLCDFSQLEEYAENPGSVLAFWDEVLNSRALKKLETLTLRSVKGPEAAEVVQRSREKCGVVTIDE